MDVQNKLTQIATMIWQLQQQEEEVTLLINPHHDGDEDWASFLGFCKRHLVQAQPLLFITEIIELSMCGDPDLPDFCIMRNENASQLCRMDMGVMPTIEIILTVAN